MARANNRTQYVTQWEDHLNQMFYVMMDAKTQMEDNAEIYAAIEKLKWMIQKAGDNNFPEEK